MTDAYVRPLVEDGVTAHIANVRTRVGVVRVDDLALPFTVNDCEPGNSYVCSPYDHYVDYAREELRNLASPLLSGLLGGLLLGVGAVFRWASLDRVVHVNNWLVSTNLYPPLTTAQIAEVTRRLRAEYPDHALAWRSVCGAPLRAAFAQAGYRAVPSRQIYLLEPDRLNHASRRIWRRDLRLLDRGPYEVVVPTPEDLPRLKELYDLLYLRKYSMHNPQFTVRYLAAVLASGALELRALRHRETGRLDGLAGWFERHGTLTTPLFGYDTSLPQGVGLYRMLSALVFRRAQERGLLLHMSSGAAGFKRCRGGRAEIEVSMVLYRHLPWRRRLAWELLGALLQGVAVPLLRHYRL